jgi:quercetin dioxygenase-like cupin family protein
MLNSKRLKAAAAILGIAMAGTIATPALASPGSGTIITTNFVTSDLDKDVQVNNTRVKFQTKDGTDVRVQKLEFPPGAFTGWHHHPGLVLVVVESGSLTLTDASCATKAYGPGSPNGAVFVEGDDHAHEASSSGGATVYVTYVVPSASPAVFRNEDPVPFCAQP